MSFFSDLTGTDFGKLRSSLQGGFHGGSFSEAGKSAIRAFDPLISKEQLMNNTSKGLGGGAIFSNSTMGNQSDAANNVGKFVASYWAGGGKVGELGQGIGGLFSGNGTSGLSSSGSSSLSSGSNYNTGGSWSNYAFDGTPTTDYSAMAGSGDSTLGGINGSGSLSDSIYNAGYSSTDGTLVSQGGTGTGLDSGTPSSWWDRVSSQSNSSRSNSSSGQAKKKDSPQMQYPSVQHPRSLTTFHMPSNNDAPQPDTAKYKQLYQILQGIGR